MQCSDDARRLGKPLPWGESRRKCPVESPPASTPFPLSTAVGQKDSIALEERHTVEKSRFVVAEVQQ